MISTVHVSNPGPQIAYRIDDFAVEFRDLQGNLLDVVAYEVLEAPAFQNPSWYTPPDPVQVVSETARLITKLAFRLRFTMTERAMIEIASVDRHGDDTPTQIRSATLRACFRDIEAVSYVDLDYPQTRNGVLMLEQAELLGVGRALEILDAPVLPAERAERI